MFDGVPLSLSVCHKCLAPVAKFSLGGPNSSTPDADLGGMVFHLQFHSYPEVPGC